MDLLVGLSSWIIQDGNYPDFRVGQRYRTAFEYYEPRLSPGPPHAVGLTPIESQFYQVNAAVVYATRELFVVDAGVKLFTESPRSPLHPIGTHLTGSLGIGIDPFDYFEGLQDNPQWPCLFYTWRLEEIRLVTTPWVTTHDDRGVPIASRSPGVQTFRTILSTDAHHDDDGNAEYILLCRDTQVAV